MLIYVDDAQFSKLEKLLGDRKDVDLRYLPVNDVSLFIEQLHENLSVVFDGQSRLTALTIKKDHPRIPLVMVGAHPDHESSGLHWITSLDYVTPEELLAILKPAKKL